MADPEFTENLARWHRDPWALQALFSEAELARLDALRRTVRKDNRTVVFCVYENQFAKAGGLFAVASHLPRAIQQHHGSALVLSPLHTKLSTAPPKPEGSSPDGPLSPCGRTAVPFGDAVVDVTLWQQDLGGVRWVLFEAAGFFEAGGGPKGNIPYDFTSPDGSPATPRLDVDSLFAAAAVPHILKQLGVSDDVVIHIQDWQFVATALTAKLAMLEGILNSAAVLLTSHNPYDSSLAADQLSLITSRVEDRQWPSLRTSGSDGLAAPSRRETFYECMIPLLDAPLSTVSKCFARDLTSHPIQTVHFADHLQEVFHRQGVVGVDNGLFFAVTTRAFSESAISQAKRGRTDEILKEKKDKRRLLIDHLREYLPDSACGSLDDGSGGSLDGLPESVPIFMMFGRMDPAQKGFDLLARAVEKIDRGAAKFIFALEAAGGVRLFIEDLRRLAEDRQGDVVFVSDRMETGYLETMAAASFCVMPSLHEPFGAATEPYLKGTPVVAHATGGLLQQVKDYRHEPDQATGFLYRADCSGPVAEQLGRYWDELLDCTDPEKRKANPLYSSLIDALAGALQEAINVYSQQPNCYGRMLANLHDQATRFSWDTAADEYSALYDLATG